MNATLIKRLFKIISSGNINDLQKIAKTIIEEESKKGHTKLVSELNKILASNSELNPRNTNRELPEKSKDYIDRVDSNSIQEKHFSTLPKNARYDFPLGTYIETTKLEHEMILPNDIEERFKRIEKEYAARDRLALYGLLPRKKILLYGQPGCGKTLGAQRLAWNTGLPLIKVRFDSIVSSYLGETATNLRKLFEVATQSPCLLFFDEFDSVAQSRKSNQEVGEIRRVVNSFLQLLDEYNAPGLLVAATNLDEQLDPAVWRRFDDVFEIPKPGPDELVKLIKMTISSIGYNTIDWEKIVEETNGFSAAQMVRSSRDAAKRVILDGNNIIRTEDLIKAIRENGGAR
ncbi:AAA family ATPase [Paenibacillus chitinolyticus]|uniref:AAA family ATPase n=1 Tax=Paenibacillus chitinolyticus TaxID=79263 RepID=UPI00362BF9DC